MVLSLCYPFHSTLTRWVGPDSFQSSSGIFSFPLSLCMNSLIWHENDIPLSFPNFPHPISLAWKIGSSDYCHLI